VAGVINAPLLADDHISTGPNSRAEVEFDAANLLRLGGTAEIRIAALEADGCKSSSLTAPYLPRVKPSSTNAEVDTPNILYANKSRDLSHFRTDAGQTNSPSEEGTSRCSRPAARSG